MSDGKQPPERPRPPHRPPGPPLPPPPQPFVPVEMFRARIRAFADAEIYPDEYVAYWLALAECVVDRFSWSCLYELGIMLWAAHEMAKLRMAEEAGPENPLGIIGVPQSKSVGPVSVSYDTSLGQEDPAAGQYNLTIYGRQFYHYAKLMGMGPVQIGAISPGLPLGAAGAWRGPVPWVGWFSG